MEKKNNLKLLAKFVQLYLHLKRKPAKAFSSMSGDVAQDVQALVTLKPRRWPNKMGTWLVCRKKTVKKLEIIWVTSKSPEFLGSPTQNKIGDERDRGSKNFFGCQYQRAAKRKIQLTHHDFIQANPKSGPAQSKVIKDHWKACIGMKMCMSVSQSGVSTKLRWSDTLKVETKKGVIKLPLRFSHHYFTKICTHKTLSRLYKTFNISWLKITWIPCYRSCWINWIPLQIPELCLTLSSRMEKPKLGNAKKVEGAIKWQKTQSSPGQLRSSI